ncbi:MAG: sulfatase [Pirellulaceae bacterium]|nr:sulfatase [Pirellulaceae bacterium]
MKSLTSSSRLCFLCAILLGRSLIGADLPNVVVIFIDDMGYADIGPFGAKSYPTPNLDRMAREGRRFTDFHVSSAVCSASRSALMTGCYHERVGISGALGPSSRIGLSAGETTLAEICKQKNYATTCIGKWHLGHHPMFLPTNHGFDSYYGLPYSNDMWPNHPEELAKKAKGKVLKGGYPLLPLVENTKIIDAEVTGDDQMQLTTNYTNRAVDFIRQHRHEPFLVYLPHSMVHVPLYVSSKFAGKSGAGLFGDVVMEVDWSVGQILDTLKEVGVDEKTLVVFTTDNGPWLSYGDHAGSALPHREGKGTAWEGGIRVPTLMRWPSKIPAGTTCDELACTVDILPTVAAMIGAELPKHKIDGQNIMPLMTGGSEVKSPHETMPCYFASDELQGIRDREWKLILPHQYRTLAGKPVGTGGIPAQYETAKVGLELYNMKNDRSETKNVAADHPEIVARLEAAAEAWRFELGDKLTNRKGSGVRPHATMTESDAVLK